MTEKQIKGWVRTHVWFDKSAWIADLDRPRRARRVKGRAHGEHG